MDTEDLLQITREMTAVHQLGTEIGDDPDHPRRREYRIRRAAAADRFADGDGIHVIQSAEAVADAVHYAEALLAVDRLDDTGRGPIPAHDPRWTDDPRGYARQEHRAWVLEHDVP